ncbi:hypothetical protein AS144_01595 [Francisella endosymbiont of Amblyomma maculatum]|nr:hypothetical protein AS144_01595 [Francisella endosymbiont of Amblyomma maculatum]
MVGGNLMIVESLYSVLKITEYIENKALNKFYDKNNVSMGVSLSCADVNNFNELVEKYGRVNPSVISSQ